ncbi:MAG: MarR family transcriptional regulator [Bacteroidetes bacterium]|nr:MAG: MarR family transcriptional regulator [Bacteroidota bacterium]
MNKPLEEVYIYLIERTARRFKKTSQMVFKEHGIDLTGDQWVVLKRISERPGINQKEIADTTYKDPASVTRILDLMEKKQLVVRQPIPGNRRAYGLELTKAGADLVNKILPLAVDLRAQGIDGISEQDFETFKKVLNTIYKNFE